MRWNWFRQRACSTRLSLDFEDRLDTQLFVRGLDAREIRLTAGVRFAARGRWSEVFTAIVDTGSPDCAIPHAIWSGLDYRIVVAEPVALGGIGGGIARAPIGEVTLVVDDGRRTSPPLGVRAFLMPDDSVPLLLGFQDFLTQVALGCDYPRRNAHIEFPTAS